MNRLANGIIKWCASCIPLLLLSAGEVVGEMTMTRVVGVEGTEVALDAGMEAGLGKGAMVTLLREGEPIVHPLTGAVLGVPQEPVGMVEVVEVGATSARGVLNKRYSEPQVGDLAEYEAVEMTMAALSPVMEKPSVGVADRVEKLEKTLRQYQKSGKAIKAYPTFVQQVWDEIMAMRSHLLSVDERLVDLEEQQGADRIRLSSLVSGDFRQGGTEEFTIRYMPGTDVRLKIAGKTLLITVDQDSVYHLQDPDAADDPLMIGDEGREEEADGESFDIGAWIDSNSDYMMWGVVGLFVLVALYIIPTLLRSRKDDDGEEDDFDDEYDEDFLDEEEEE